MKKQTYNAIITEDDRLYVALNPEFDIASQGSTVKEALANLQEALELYFEVSKEQNVSPHKSFLKTFSL